jgi:UDP-N-acetylmuramate dehydrogenase
MADGDVTLLLGAGDIIALVPCVKSDMSGAAHPPRKILIGQGSNTWKSDLNLSVEYVKAEGPAGESGAKLLAERPGLCPWMAGIPGTIGGWVKMNAGAFGHSISEVIESVKVDGKWIPKDACGFGYRTSAIDGEIQDVRWLDCSCSEGDAASFLARRKKFPAGTKGSVFKNPKGDFAGRLLEEAGAKGLRVGGAYVWDGHANVIVSGPDATPSDFLALARLMREKVWFRFGIRLEPEVRGLVFDDRTRPEATSRTV